MRVPLSWLLEYAPRRAAGRRSTPTRSAARLTGLRPGDRDARARRPGHHRRGGRAGAGRRGADRVQASRSGTARSTTGRRPGAARHLRRGNFAAGDRVALALPGAVLPGGFEIGARKTYGQRLRGHDLLGRGAGASATTTPASWCCRRTRRWAPTSSSYAGLRDVVLDVNVTPDKGFALSVRGVARELAISYDVPFTDPADAGLPADVAALSAEVYPASIADPTACDRFVLREVRGIDPARPTPLRMQVRLARAGQRSVSLAVDVTNYLMLELGQPLHAFDRARLSGPIVVRRARPGEQLETLDHVVRDAGSRGHPDHRLLRARSRWPARWAGWRPRSPTTPATWSSRPRTSPPAAPPG